MGVRTYLCTVFCLLLAHSLGASALGLDSDLWIQLASPANPPSAREGHTAVVNAVNNTMVLFGGKDSTKSYNDMHILHLVNDQWVVGKPAGFAPQARYSHSAVVTVDNRMIIFGGRNETADFFNDIAVFDLVNDTWLMVVVSGEPPVGRAGHTAVVDPIRNQMVVYGGIDSTNHYLNDVSFLDLSTYTWVNKASNGTALARAFHATVLSPLNVMVTFGGTNGSPLKDTSCYSLATNMWWACGSTSPAPDARFGHTAVHSALHKMMVFGGKDGGGNALTEVWAFDFVHYKWEMVIPGGASIDGRYFHTSVATPFNTMVVFGGVNQDGTDTNDFGKYNLVQAVLSSYDDGTTMVVLITLLGTLLISMCFALDYIQEQNSIEKQEAIAKARAQGAATARKPLIPMPQLGPKATKFFEDFKVSLDPLRDPPK